MKRLAMLGGAVAGLALASSAFAEAGPSPARALPNKPLLVSARRKEVVQRKQAARDKVRAEAAEALAKFRRTRHPRSLPTKPKTHAKLRGLGWVGHLHAPARRAAILKGATL